MVKNQSGKLLVDPRYKIANREAIIGIILAVINFIWWFAFAFGLGSKKVADYHYVMGLPAWFFYSCVVGFIVITILLIVAVKFLFKEIPLDDMPDQDRGDHK
ncbi:putative membrane protein YhdT [Scopulibacillus darangshiensis]|uniref:Putative membrane protein YhdT n=1 Tax=Scopulibacillus darangshiensis TaxID=442528 RepID=A0A4R2P239_9BACL|nr:YhdT family protein [Scopulibacillus darangshiensis]TCP28773.1 putative membrane protein YhdT [Scopulibacillus darangshiensis]